MMSGYTTEKLKELDFTKVVWLPRHMTFSKRGDEVMKESFNTGVSASSRAMGKAAWVLDGGMVLYPLCTPPFAWALSYVTYLLQTSFFFAGRQSALA